MGGEFVVTASNAGWRAEATLSAWRACNFLLLRQKKVTKEKATPGSTPGCARSLALLGLPGGSLNSPAARTTRPESPRKPCVAQRLPWGDGHPVPNRCAAASGREVLDERLPVSARPPLGPLRGAEQRRGLGGSRLALSEPPRGASLARRPSPRVAQGSPRRGPPTQGWLLLCLLSSCHQEESTAALRRGNHEFRKEAGPRSRSATHGVWETCRPGSRVDP